jgi:hypothetical protein
MCLLYQLVRRIRKYFQEFDYISIKTLIFNISRRLSHTLLYHAACGRHTSVLHGTSARTTRETRCHYHLGKSRSIVEGTFFRWFYSNKNSILRKENSTQVSIELLIFLLRIKCCSDGGFSIIIFWIFPLAGNRLCSRSHRVLRWFLLQCHNCLVAKVLLRLHYRCVAVDVLHQCMEHKLLQTSEFSSPSIWVFRLKF